MTASLSIRKLVKCYGGRPAVDEASLEVRVGAVVGLIGPNGSGKSSILHSIAGIDHRNTLAKRRLDLVRRLQQGYDSTITERLAETLSLPPGLPQLVSEYSHGMKRKIQLVAALSHRPSLLVLDEPYRGLDPASAYCLRMLVEAFAAQGGGVLIAIHDLAVAHSYCNEVAALSDGTIVAEGTPGTLLEEAELASQTCNAAARLCELELTLQ